MQYWQQLRGLCPNSVVLNLHIGRLLDGNQMEGKSKRKEDLAKYRKLLQKERNIFSIWNSSDGYLITRNLQGGDIELLLLFHKKKERK